MNFPKIKSAKVVDENTIVIQFDNQLKKKYDITNLLKNKMFYPLKNQALFNSVQIEKGGYAIFWNSDIDISEHELWVNGTTIQ